MSMDYLDQKRESDMLARERAEECGICGVKFGVGPGLERKAKGQVDKEQPGLAACLSCAQEQYGDENVDGDPIDERDEADDVTLYPNAGESPSYRSAMIDAGRGHLLR